MFNFVVTFEPGTVACNIKYDIQMLKFTLLFEALNVTWSNLQRCCT